MGQSRRPDADTARPQESIFTGSLQRLFAQAGRRFDYDSRFAKPSPAQPGTLYQSSCTERLTAKTREVTGVESFLPIPHRQITL